MIYIRHNGASADAPLCHFHGKYMQLFRNQKAVICCGQGAWEQPDTTWYLKRIFEAKGIPVWVDLWGHDVKHDWDWWYKQVVYYMPYILGQQ